MKKSILAISIVLMYGSLFAQTFIPRVGMTLSSSTFEPAGYFTGDEKSSSAAMSGLTAGVGYEYKLSELISLQPEINFIQKGQKLEELAYPDGIEYSVNTEVKYNYLEIPVLAKATFGGTIKFYVAAGPSVGIGLGGKYKQHSSFGGFEESTIEGKIKFKDEPNDYEGNDLFVENKVDFGLQLGGGVVFCNKFIIDARYGIGLSDLSSQETSKNRVLQLSIGVPLSLF